MKKQGSIAEFKAERAAAIVEAYREEIRNAKTINVKEIIARVVSSPCQRFWVSEERAAAVLSRLIKGTLRLEDMTDGHARMYGEILRRVKILQPSHKGTFIKLVRKVIYDTAPEFYITPDHAYNIILKQRA